MKLLRPLALALCASSVACAAAQQFSIPVTSTDCAAAPASARAQAIAGAATMVHNQPRTKTLLGTNDSYPLNTGPVYRAPTDPLFATQALYMKDLAAQSAVLGKLDNPNSDAIRVASREFLSAITAAGSKPNYDDYVRMYQMLEDKQFLAKPFALDNSDEVFGSVRLGVRGHNMKLVTRDDVVYAADLAQVASDSLVDRVCDKGTLNFAYDRRHVFVTDFSDTAKYNDYKGKYDKFGVEALGYFCFNSKRQLMMPLAIKILESGLIYTRDDSPGEWQFAKMALDAVELNYQQMRHLVEVHLISIPIEVEMMRTMSASHPIYQLLKHHFFGNFGLELRGSQILLELDTPYDKTLSYGARGSLVYLMDEFQHVNVSESVKDEFERRGLSHVLINRLAKYGVKYSDMINNFVRSYTFAFYRSDSQVAQDCELQNWASNVQRIPEIHGFPTSFTTRGQLQRLVAQLIFQNAVKHHFMNGAVSWHSTAAPFSTPSLWNRAKGVPMQKGAEIDLLDYVMPAEIVPDLAYMASRFNRPIPREVTLLEVYQNTTIGAQAAVQPAIEQLRTDMAEMEQYVLAEEAKTTLPLDFFRPSKLPYFSYI